MNSYNKLICLLALITDLYLFRSPVRHILVLIAKLCFFRSPVGVPKLILILVLLADLYLYRGTRRCHRAYTYTNVPVGTIEQNDIHFFTLIHHSDSYHITVGLPRLVIRNE